MKTIAGITSPSVLTRSLCAATGIALALALQVPSAFAEDQEVAEPVGEEQAADADSSEKGEPSNRTIETPDDFKPVVLSDMSDEYANYVDATYVDESGETKTVKAIPVTRSNPHITPTQSGYFNGWFVVTEDVAIANREAVLNNTRIIIADGCTLTCNGGIEVRKGTSLDIYGESETGGTLVANGFRSKRCAGIGGTSEYSGSTTAHGNISIHSGTVEATGSMMSAGIGSAYDCTGNGTISIYGGDVTATGGPGSQSDVPGNSAGIGGGELGDFGKVRIFGGKVTATGSDGGAGIGGSPQGHGSIEIHGGTIVAKGGPNGSGVSGGGAGIGCRTRYKSSDVQECADISVTIDGGYVEATGRDGGAGIGGGNKAAISSITIMGGTVKANGTVGIGNGSKGSGSSIVLGYKDPEDIFITASSYAGTLSVADGQKLAASDGSFAIEDQVEDVKPLAGKTLTAPHQRTVTWDPCNHEEPTTQDVLTPETVTMPDAPKNVPEGTKGFLGWRVGEKTLQTGDTYTVTDNVTITAAWDYIDYHVSIDDSLRDLVSADKEPVHVEETVTLTTAFPWGRHFKGGLPTVVRTDGGEEPVDVEAGDEPGTFTFTMPAGDIHVKGEVEDIDFEEPSFGEPHVDRTGSLGLTAFVNLPDDEDLSWNDSYMEFSVSGKKKRTVKVGFDEAIADEEANAYGFTCPLASIEMAQDITATFHYGDGRTIMEKGLSLQGCMRHISDSLITGPRSYSDAEIVLAQTEADYCYFAQRFLATQDKWTLGVDYSAIDYYLTRPGLFNEDGAREMLSAFGVTKNLDTSSVTKLYSSLEFGSDTTLNITFNVTALAKLTAEAKFNGETYTAQKLTDTKYRLSIPGIKGHQLDCPIAISGYCNGHFNVELSALSYANALINSKSRTPEAVDAICAFQQYYYASCDMAAE